jgi:capsular exopolysaccharide synthesis family protein
MQNTKDLLININPKSMFSESIKTIRTNLQFSGVDKGLKVILVTSPEAGDGKSFISANLAVAYAQDGKNVLIIDADLRRGREHKIFNTMNPTGGGYSNLILRYKDEIKLSRYVIATSVENIDLIPTGPTPPNPIELLSSANNKKIIKELREIYDIIILDCPPVLGLSDTLILSKYSDANVLVVSSGKTPVESINKVQQAFKNANNKIDGVIINRAQVKGSAYNSYYSSEYYYYEADPEEKK